MSSTIFRVSVGFLVGVLTLMALALSLADRYTEESRRLAAAGDARGALEASRLSARMDPFETEALETQSSILQQQQRYEAAAVVLREAIARDPNNYLPYFLLGNLRLAEDDPEAAVESYRDVLRLNPKATSASIVMAQTLIGQGKLKEAEEELLVLEREGRISFEGLYDLGRIEVRTGRAEEGLKDIRKARRQAEAGLEELEGSLRQQREQLLVSMDLAVADAMVVAGREGQAREILANSASEQAPSLLQLLDSDPVSYREQVVNSDIY